jgi:DNA-binding MarR family transcriptional regulator
LNTRDTVDHEIAILESIRSSREQRPVRQRDLARIVGISLGMTNVILRKLAQKGWVTFRRINSRHIQYAITPAGMDAIARRSYRYLKRVVRNVVRYKEILKEFLASVKCDGYRGITLVGKSDFDFILEHLCLQQELTFSQAETPSAEAGMFVIYAEDERVAAILPRKAGRGGARLRDVLMRG